MTTLAWVISITALLCAIRTYHAITGRWL